MLTFNAVNHQPRSCASKTTSKKSVRFSKPLPFTALQQMFYFLWHFLLSVAAFGESHNSPAPQPKYMLYQNIFFLRHFRSFGMTQKLKSIFCSFREFKFISYPCQVAHSPRGSNVSHPCGHLHMPTYLHITKNKTNSF